MRVTEITTQIVSMPFNEVEYSAIGVDDRATEVILHVHTDEGITGIGEALATFCPEAVEIAIHKMAPFIVGYSPFEIEAFYQRTFAGRWQYFRHFGHTAFNGIEIALWDIIGKATNRPIHDLMGGAVHEKIDHYFWIQRKDPALMEQEAREGLRQGFTVFYTKAGIDPKSDIEAVAAIRAGLGPGVALRVDANAAWTPAQAIQIINEMNRYDLDFIEQPISIEDLDGLKHIREMTGVTMCLDQGVWTQRDIYEALHRGVADYVCTEPARTGGLLEFKKVCSLVEIANAQVCRHVGPEFGIMSAAAMHVCATVRNLPLGHQTWVGLLDDDILVEDLRTFDNGTLTVPKGPGLGVSIDYDKLERYSVSA